MSKGFSHCEAGPLVRSSYHADEQVNEASKSVRRKRNKENARALWRFSRINFGRKGRFFSSYGRNSSCHLHLLDSICSRLEGILHLLNRFG